VKPATVLVLSLVGWLAASTVGAAIDNAPQLISPGYGRADARVGTLCPTFTWTTSPESIGSAHRPARIFWAIVRGGSPARARIVARR